jgi:hypothetical protein
VEKFSALATTKASYYYSHFHLQSMQHHVRPLLFPALLVVVLMLASTVLGQTDCCSKVGNYTYDLTPLAQKLGAVDLQMWDSRSQTYYYHVCRVVSNNFCQTVEDLMPKAHSAIPFHFLLCAVFAYFLLVT